MQIRSEWFFEWGGGVTEGPFFNAITPAGYSLVAELISHEPAPWLALGQDTSDTFDLGETFRKPVSLVSQDWTVVRFRTQLVPTDANGTHQKLSILLRASETPGGTELMFNQLKQPFTKASNQLLTVECRIYIIPGVID